MIHWAYFIHHALAGKIILASAASAAITYVAVKEYERSQQWKRIVEQNWAFGTVYTNEEFNSNFNSADFKEQITALKELNKEGIISEDEFKTLSAELLKAK